ncbi:hypothetical protein L873DRAFT_1801753 [Choiromyces venosus 120613-1]|uniref:Uncharacterized protein n=1 Tax=Choiromyces venosus 120613-1 TaxID=1336337 RepID=A0A3N4JWL6_9PEZI|nr:hypothetical protein L873DRAFT_1801753 [Choiromyces venosus 120613-1]
MIPENTMMIHICLPNISTLVHTCPHFSPHFRTCPEPSTMPDNNPETSLITTSEPPTSNNLRQLTNKFHLLSSRLCNVPTIGQAGRFM